MKRIQLYAAGVVVALVPAVVGLAGNASFSQSVPVRSPERARTTGTTPTPSPTHDAIDDRGRRHGGHGADDAVPGSGVASSTPTDDATHDATHDANDDHGRRHGGHGADDPATHDANDDHGGDRRHQAEAGDDDGGNRGSGSDSSGSSRSGSDDSGHHSGGDDSGSGGHGSDD